MCTTPYKIYFSEENFVSSIQNYYVYSKNDEVFLPQEPTKIKGFSVEKSYIIPCGKCIECCLRRASEWSLRLIHESKFHEASCFLTLTYNDKHIPFAKYDYCYTLYKRHLQLFMKRLRKKFPSIKFRYYGCGEYGDTTARPHYHMILFGTDFSDDRELFSCGKHNLYISKTLNDLWGLGFCTIGDLTLKTAGYVAGYVTKKLKSKFKATEDYNKLADSLNISITDLYKNALIRVPEFSIMSNRPGIGYSILDDYGEQFLQHRYILNSNKKKCLIPRYYLKKLQERYPDLYSEYEDDLATLESPSPKDLYRRHKYRDAIHKKFTRNVV